jgi:hypothetical protein
LAREEARGEGELTRDRFVAGDGVGTAPARGHGGGRCGGISDEEISRANQHVSARARG